MLAIATDLSHTDFKQRDSNIYLIITSFVGGQTGQRDGLNVMKLSINTERGDFTVNSDKLLLYRCDKSLLNDFSLQFKNYTKQKNTISLYCQTMLGICYTNFNSHLF